MQSVEQLNTNNNPFNTQQELEYLAWPRIDHHINYQDSTIEATIALHEETYELLAHTTEQIYSIAA